MGYAGRDLPPRILHDTGRLQLCGGRTGTARWPRRCAVFILDYFRTSATEDGHRNAGHGQGMFLAQSSRNGWRMRKASERTRMDREPSGRLELGRQRARSRRLSVAPALAGSATGPGWIT